MPSWGNPADAPSRGTSLANWKRALPAWPPQTPSVHFGSRAVACELHLLREPLPEAAVEKLGACYQPESDTTVQDLQTSACHQPHDDTTVARLQGCQLARLRIMETFSFLEGYDRTTKRTAIFARGQQCSTVPHSLQQTPSSPPPSPTATDSGREGLAGEAPFPYQLL